MRRSSLNLTMNVHTDLSLLDVAGVLEALPELLVEVPGLLAAIASGWRASGRCCPVLLCHGHAIAGRGTISLRVVTRTHVRQRHLEFAARP